MGYTSDYAKAAAQLYAPHVREEMPFRRASTELVSFGQLAPELDRLRKALNRDFATNGWPVVVSGISDCGEGLRLLPFVLGPAGPLDPGELSPEVWHLIHVRIRYVSAREEIPVAVYLGDPEWLWLL